MFRLLTLALLLAVPAAAQEVRLTPEIPFVEMEIDGRFVFIEREQDNSAVVDPSFARVARPEVFRKLQEPVKLPASVVEAAFLKANPGWRANMITITCREGRIQEARLCLSKDLNPVPCGRDVAADCRLDDALLAPVR